MESMKKVLIIVAIVTLVAITGSMVYYFAFAKPASVRAELEWEREKQNKADTKERMEKREAEAEELERDYMLNQCLADAYDNYIEAWGEQAKRLGIEDGFLPGETADALNEAHEKAQEHCFKLYGPE